MPKDHHADDVRQFDRMPPMHDLLELLFGDGHIPLTQCLVQIPDARVCLGVISQMVQKGWVELCEGDEQSLSPMPLWKWRAYCREQGKDVEQRISLRRTQGGNDEWGRFYHEGTES